MLKTDHAYREGAYYLPNDEEEQARLDLLHHVSRLSLDGALYVAPLSAYGDIERCLDFGTGTGLWVSVSVAINRERLS